MKLVLNIMERINRILLKLEEIIMALASFGLLFAIFIQVVCRYLLKVPTPWAEELARYLFVLMSFVGSAYALANSSHIEINLIDQVVQKYFRNPIRMRRIIEASGIILTIVFLCVFGVVFSEFLSNIARRGQASASMQIPMVYPMGSILVGTVLTTFHGVYLLLRQNWKGGAE